MSTEQATTEPTEEEIQYNRRTQLWYDFEAALQRWAQNRIAKEEVNTGITVGADRTSLTDSIEVSVGGLRLLVRDWWWEA